MVEPRIRESRLLDLLGQRYEERGYAFFKYPPKEVLPAFLRNIRPDAIALGPDDNVVIEIRLGNETGAAKIAQLLKEHAKWRLDLVSAGEPDIADPVLASPSQGLVNYAVAQSRSLEEKGFAEAAFLIAWSALEAAARLQDTKNRHRSRTAQGLIEFLEREGLIDYETANALKPLAHLRNRLVHGDFEAKVPQGAQPLILRTAEELSSGLPHGQAI